MKLTPCHSLMLAAACVVGLSSQASAESLNAAHVPADAKWVMHVDFDAFQQTALAGKMREKKADDIEKAEQKFQEKYGVDLKDGLKGVTAFGSTYEAHTGTMIVLASYDMQKVQKEIRSKDKVKSMKIGGHPAFVITKTKGEHHGAEHGDRAHRDQARDKSSKNNRSADRERSGPRMGQPETMVVVLVDGEQVVLSSSQELADRAIALLSGESKSLEGADSPLTAKVPQGSVFYGAATNLQSISQRDGFFPILQQHQQITYAVGENNGEAFKDVTLQANSEQVAGQVKNTIDGLMAFAKLWAGNEERLQQVFTHAQVKQEGDTVKAEYRGDADEVLDAMSALKERAEQWEQKQQKSRERNRDER
ncbi:hypothetical protein [Rubinisphaera margarita]|uniref:hypothetical protein n=1 Tax=Rubinisphaera margarita TaxID=2909586 RepID=UPI001EE94AB3|nr:hypothetical protein [Rubinisphaera margarita]MCG6156627.1 hypothetical protein [Rubinisphaera margarita]